MTAPVESTRGPPELPGLIAASVCKALIKELSVAESPAVTGRFFALMIPKVTVPDKPSGEPIAITGSPTATLSLSPNWRAGRFFALIFNTARSYEESRPRIVPSYISPLLSVTRIVPPFSATAAITWLFVKIYPLLSITKPDPVPPPLVELVVTETTDGRTR